MGASAGSEITAGLFTPVSYGDVFYVFVEDATERHLRELRDTHAVQMARERLEVLR